MAFGIKEVRREIVADLETGWPQTAVAKSDCGIAGYLSRNARTGQLRSASTFSMIDPVPCSIPPYTIFWPIDVMLFSYAQPNAIEG